MAEPYVRRDDPDDDDPTATSTTQLQRVLRGQVVEQCGRNMDSDMDVKKYSLHDHDARPQPQPRSTVAATLSSPLDEEPWSEHVVLVKERTVEFMGKGTTTTQGNRRIEAHARQFQFKRLWL